MAKKISAKAGKNKIKAAKKYRPHHLAAVLTSILILEGILFGATSSVDWQKSAAVLDVSSGVADTAQDLAATFQPMIDLTESINRFYELSAVEMMQLLDFSGSGVPDIGYIYNGVADFYQQSSIQMAQLLDLSNASFWPSKVIGLK